MNLFELALQIVPLIFISLFLDLPRIGTRSKDAPAPKNRMETTFDLIVATLGLLAFMVSLYAIGSEPTDTPEPWMRIIVIIALSFAMAALFLQVLLRITRKKALPEQASTERYHCEPTQVLCRFYAGTGSQMRAA